MIIPINRPRLAPIREPIKEDIKVGDGVRSKFMAKTIGEAISMDKIRNFFKPVPFGTVHYISFLSLI